MSKKYIGSLKQFVNKLQHVLNNYENIMEEISMSEVQKMWEVKGPNDEVIQLDLSWVSSQDDINNLQADIRNGLDMANKTLDKILTYLDYNMDDPNTAPDTEIEKWNYELDGEGGINLLSLNVDDANIIVYPKYKIGDKTYQTYLKDTSFKNKTNLVTVKFKEDINYHRLTSMMEMFYGCTSLTGVEFPIDFNTSNVTRMDSMFRKCTSLSTDLDLSMFNTSNVTNMRHMFNMIDKSHFNSSGNTYLNPSTLKVKKIDISSFDMSHVTDMKYMFARCASVTDLGTDCSNWDVSNVTDMTAAFYYCPVMINPSNWNISNVVSITHLFHGSNITGDLTKWVFNSQLNDISYAFNCAYNTDTIDLSGVSINNITKADKSFCAKNILLRNIEFGSIDYTDLKWVLASNITDGSNIDLSNSSYNNNGKSFDPIFKCYYTKLNEVTTYGEVIYSRVSESSPIHIKSINMDNFSFGTCYIISNLFFNIPSSDKNKLTDVSINNLVTSSIRYISGIFNQCNGLTTIDLSTWDTSNVVNMNNLFSYCSSLTSLDLTSFDTRTCNYMQEMFKGCINLKEILVSRDKWVISDTCNTTDMFSQCGVDHVTYVD